MVKRWGDDERLADSIIHIVQVIRALIPPDDDLDAYLDDAERQARIILDRGMPKPELSRGEQP